MGEIVSPDKCFLSMGLAVPHLRDSGILPSQKDAWKVSLNDRPKVPLLDFASLERQVFNWRLHSSAVYIPE